MRGPTFLRAIQSGRTPWIARLQLCYVLGSHGAAAMPIRLLLEEDHAFSPDDVKILVDAFEDTLRALGLTDTEDPSSIKIAKIIIGLAKDGERDPARLRDLTLKFIRPS